MFCMSTSFIIVTILSITAHLPKVISLYCYSCVSTQPGCTLEKVNWLIYSAISCPQPEDKCVKIIEQKGAEVRVTRDCLSNIMPIRDDIPADKFEGCRPASQNPKRAVFIDNAMTELDLKNDYFTNITYCFCEFDQWCNGSGTVQSNFTTILAIFFLLLIFNAAIN